jgi:hypothetical protein
MKRNPRDYRKFEEIACTTKEDCEKIKTHLNLVFCEMNLNIRIIYSYANKYRMYVGVNAFEYKLLSFYLSSTIIKGVKIWNF